MSISSDASSYEPPPSVGSAASSSSKPIIPNPVDEIAHIIFSEDRRPAFFSNVTSLLDRITNLNPIFYYPLMKISEDDLTGKLAKKIKKIFPYLDGVPVYKNYHDVLFELFEELGYYRMSTGGICAGFAMMGIQAVLSNDIQSFNKRLENLANLIYEHKGNVSEVAELLYYLNDENLSEKDRHDFVDYLSLFDGIALCLGPDSFPECFELNNRPIWQSDLVHVLNLVESKELEKKGGGVEIIQFSGCYSREELKEYLELLVATAEKSQVSIGINLFTNIHSISICYDHVKQKWIFIDVGQLPVREFDVSTPDLINTLSDCIFQAFYRPQDDCVVLGSQCYTDQDSHKELLQSFERRNSEFEAINKFSDKKIIKYGVRWLIQTITQLKNPVTIEDKPLFKASQHKLKSTIYSLMKRLKTLGRDINGTDEEDQTPLHLAVTIGQLEIVNALLKQKANINKVDKDGSTPLHLAALMNHVDVLKRLLLTEGIRVNRADHKDRTALHRAARYGNVDIVRVLLETKGLLIDQTDIDNQTALHLAAEHGHTDIVKLLLEKNVDINRGGYDRETPLHLAAKWGYIDIVNLLLEKGVDIHKLNKNDQTALDLALEYEYEDVARILRKYPN